MKPAHLLLCLTLLPALPAQAASSVATFAGGCFWCSESDFEKLKGVQSVVSGYIGGRTVSPTYEEVSAGSTGHTEGVQITYDPAVISYGQLLTWFWQHHDPFDAGGQFCDRGSQYRPAIFTHDAAQAAAAKASRDRLAARMKKPVATEIAPAGPFYAAEDYHQDYYRKNDFRYRYYRLSCGRDARIKALGIAP